MRKIVALCWALVLLPFCCFAQDTDIERDIRLLRPVGPLRLITVSGFLEVCGREFTQLSKERMEAWAEGPPGEYIDAMRKALAGGVADQYVCRAYLWGLYEGWKEGHKHGVLAAKFPAGIPRDLSTAVNSLPGEELEATAAAFENDVPCIPDDTTDGELYDIVVKYLRDHIEGRPFSNFLLMRTVFPVALREAFPCPVAEPATPK